MKTQIEKIEAALENQDLRALLSEKVGIKYETEEFNEATGFDCDLMFDNDTEEFYFVKQGTGSTFEEQNNSILIDSFIWIEYEEDIENYIENYIGK